MEYIKAKTIVTRSKPKSWFGYEYNMNIYRGCNHGCIYCDSRSDCYRVENFDTIRAKEDALKIIRDDLRRKVRTGVVCTGAMSDPYNCFEKELQLTRHSLELINAFGFGIGIMTKSNLITRDIDILLDIQEHSPVLAKMTVTMWDDDMAKKIEPGASLPSKRFQALKEMSDAGLFCGILLMPVLPFINDTEENILGIVEQAAKSGVKFIYPSMGVTLRSNQRKWYYDKLDQQFPGIKEKYIQMYGDKYYCNSPHTRRLMKVFREACNKYNILYDMDRIIRKSREKYECRQLSLF
jgi:DNA repair photolyase